MSSYTESARPILSPREMIIIVVYSGPLASTPFTYKARKAFFVESVAPCSVS